MTRELIFGLASLGLLLLIVRWSRRRDRADYVENPERFRDPSRWDHLERQER